MDRVNIRSDNEWPLSLYYPHLADTGCRQFFARIHDGYGKGMYDIGFGKPITVQQHKNHEVGPENVCILYWHPKNEASQKERRHKNGKDEAMYDFVFALRIEDTVDGHPVKEYRRYHAQLDGPKMHPRSLIDYPRGKCKDPDLTQEEVEALKMPPCKRYSVEKVRSDGKTIPLSLTNVPVVCPRYWNSHMVKAPWSSGKARKRNTKSQPDAPEKPPKKAESKSKTKQSAAKKQQKMNSDAEPKQSADKKAQKQTKMKTAAEPKQSADKKPQKKKKNNPVATPKQQKDKPQPRPAKEPAPKDNAKKKITPEDFVKPTPISPDMLENPEIKKRHKTPPLAHEFDDVNFFSDASDESPPPAPKKRKRPKESRVPEPESATQPSQPEAQEEKRQKKEKKAAKAVATKPIATSQAADETVDQVVDNELAPDSQLQTHDTCPMQDIDSDDDNPYTQELDDLPSGEMEDDRMEDEQVQVHESQEETAEASMTPSSPPTDYGLESNDDLYGDSDDDEDADVCQIVDDDLPIDNPYTVETLPEDAVDPGWRSFFKVASSEKEPVVCPFIRLESESIIPFRDRSREVRNRPNEASMTDEQIVANRAKNVLKATKMLSTKLLSSVGIYRMRKKNVQPASEDQNELADTKSQHQIKRTKTVGPPGTQEGPHRIADQQPSTLTMNNELLKRGCTREFDHTCQPFMIAIRGVAQYKLVKFIKEQKDPQRRKELNERSMAAQKAGLRETLDLLCELVPDSLSQHLQNEAVFQNLMEEDKIKYGRKKHIDSRKTQIKHFLDVFLACGWPVMKELEEMYIRENSLQRESIMKKQLEIQDLRTKLAQASKKPDQKRQQPKIRPIVEPVEESEDEDFFV